MNDTTMMAIAVDIGGHGAKGHVVNAVGQVQGLAIQVRYPSVIRAPGIDKRDVPGQERIEAARTIIDQLRKRHPDVSHFGIATTGTVNPATGAVIRDQSPTYQGTNWPHVLLDSKSLLPSDKLAIQNDAKAGVWAEYRAWNKHPASHLCPDPLVFVRVTVGSGVGSAIVYENKVMQGAGFVAGEFTYMPFRPPDGLEDVIPAVPCNDRRSGCTESFAASPGILRGASKAIAQKQTRWAKSITDVGAITILDVAEGMRQGDQGIRNVVRVASAALGSAIMNIIYLLGPNVITVGGGVLEALPDYFEQANQYIQDHGVIAPAIAAALVKKAQVSSDDAAAIGVARLALDEGRRAGEY